MPMTVKRFRIERAEAAPARPSSVWSKPDRRGAVGETERLVVELHALRAAIATTRREMSDLRRSPSGTDDMHRAASELDAVTAATERATTTILDAVEQIEAAAKLLKATPGLDLDQNDPLATILERVLVLYEACNFQDITGQRIRKVLQTLHFVDMRLDRVIAAWDLSAPDRPDPASADADGRGGRLSGPKLPGDEGHVSQSDVDAFLG